MNSKAPTKQSRSRKVINAANLEALGAEQLAAILLDLASSQAITKRRLRLELAAKAGADHLIVELEKLLDATGASHAKVHWRKLKVLREDLSLLRVMIAGPLAQADPAAAIHLLLQFISLERGVLARVKDVKGEIALVFDDALQDLARLCASAPAAADGLVGVMFSTLEVLGAGLMGTMMQALIPALSPEGIGQLRASVETEMAPRRRVSAGWRDALHVLLDAQGDALAYAATYSASEAVLPPIGARIARRFLGAGQIEAARLALEKSDPHAGVAGRRAQAWGVPGSDAGFIVWENAQIEVWDAKGDHEAAQDGRWAAFERELSVDQLRAYLQRLADFDDVIAADRAIAYAKSFRRFTAALQFLVDWPALADAAKLVISRAEEIDGAAIATLEPSVQALEGRYPLAATLLLRAMIARVAKLSQTEFYPRAQQWLAQAASLAVEISDFQEYEDHAAFEAGVRARLGR